MKFRTLGEAVAFAVTNISDLGKVDCIETPNGEVLGNEINHLASG
jgi:hypothetical protein